MDPHPEKPLARAIRLAGGQAALAREIEKKQQHVSFWLNQCDGRVPPASAARIELVIARLALGENVSRRELCPTFPWDDVDACAELS